MDKKLLFLERYRKEDEKGRYKLTLEPPFSFVEDDDHGQQAYTEFTSSVHKQPLK